MCSVPSRLRRSGSITFSRDQRSVEWTLDPNFATLTVVTSPSNLKYSINGEERSGDYSRRIQPDKSFRVISTDRCYSEVGEEVKAGKSGDVIEVKLAPNKVYGVVDVSARDQAGTPLEADVYVDGERLGMTPGAFKVWVCAQQFKLSHSVHGEDTSPLSLSADEVSRQVVTLRGGPRRVLGQGVSQTLSVQKSEEGASDQKRLWAWITLGLSGAALGAGVYGYLQAKEAEGAFNDGSDRPYNELKDDYERGKLISIIGVNSAIALGLASGVLFFMSPTESAGGQASIVPSRDGAFATYRWNW